MQLQLVLRHEGLALPINYRPLIHGMIYRALSNVPEYSFYLHNRDQVQKQRSYKGFTFSRLIGKYSIDRYLLHFSGNIKLEIRSYEPAFIKYLQAGLSSSTVVTLGGAEATVVDCQVTYRRLLVEQASIRIQSPVVAYRTLENRKTLFYQPDDDLFYQALEMNARRKWQFYHGDIPCEICIHPLFNDLPKKQFSTFKGTYITAWFGNYLLKGTPELIDMLYQTGLGAKNSEGFGLFDIRS